MRSRIASLLILASASIGCGNKDGGRTVEAGAAAPVDGGQPDVARDRGISTDVTPFEAYIPPYFVGSCQFPSPTGVVPLDAGTLPYGLAVLATGLRGIVALEVDSTNAYFATATSISRMPLAGNTPENMVSGAAPVTTGTAIDDSNLYWCDSSVSGQTTILSVPLSASGWQAFAGDGGAEKAATKLTSQPGNAGAFALADGYVYFGAGATVWRVPTAGGTATTVVAGIAPKGIAVRGDIVYLADDPNEAIQQVQLTGPYAGVLGGFKSSYATPKQIAVNGGDLYWGNWFGNIEYVAIAAPGARQLFSTPCHGGACQLNLVRPAGSGVVWESGDSSCSNIGIATPSGATWYAISIAATKAIAASGKHVYAATSAGQLLRWDL